MPKLRRQDLDLESAGIWHTHPDGYRVCLRAWDSPRVQARLSQLTLKRLADTKRTELPPEEYAKVIDQVVAEEVIVEWELIDDAPYSVEAAREFMASNELRNFHTFVLRGCRNELAYEKQAAEAIKGN